VKDQQNKAKNSQPRINTIANWILDHKHRMLNHVDQAVQNDGEWLCKKSLISMKHEREKTHSQATSCQQRVHRQKTSAKQFHHDSGRVEPFHGFSSIIQNRLRNVPTSTERISDRVSVWHHFVETEQSGKPH
jgi:hypothetical protein